MKHKYGMPKAVNLERSLQLLGYGVTVVTAAGIVGTGALWVWGAIESPLAFVLTLALLLSLAANAVLLFLLRSSEMKRRRAREVLQSLRQPKPSQWMRVNGDLSTLALSRGQFEHAYDAALGAARETLAPDASVTFSYVELHPDPTVVFTAWSNEAQRTAQINAQSPPGREIETEVYAIERTRPEHQAGTLPWREDDTWPEVVRLSWSRERPVSGRYNGFATLEERYDKHLLQEGVSVWQAVYATTHGDGSRSSTHYGLQDGALVVL